MTDERYRWENQIIGHYMPNSNLYAWGNLNSITPYIRMAAKTNTGNMYVLRIELTNYPNQKPNAYVEAELKDYNGYKMKELSGTNHTLENHSIHGWTQICHYHPSAWNNTMSIWMVYVRCVMWLNIYEMTLKTGHTMDRYLSHMDKDGSRC